MSDTSPATLVSESIDVAAPAASVFAIVAAPHQHPRIDGSGSVRETVNGPERLSSKGETFGVDMKLFGVPYKIRNKVVELEEDRLVAWRHFGAHRWRYEIEPTESGCTVTETFDYSRYGALGRKALEAAGFPERNRQGIHETLKRLKSAAESDAHRP